MARTYKALYPQIATFNNLYEAWRKARRGKRYKTAAAAFECHLDKELITLHRQLQTETWKPGGYRSFTVHEPKRRSSALGRCLAHSSGAQSEFRA